MNEKYIPKEEPLNSDDAWMIYDWAQTVSLWINNSPMLPKSSETLLKKFAFDEAVFVTQNDQVVGYAEYDIWNENTIEVGGLIADPEKRRQGIGVFAMKAVIELARELNPNALVFALATNEKSQKLFQSIGADDLDKTKLPTEVWEWCCDCPAFKGSTGPSHCCAKAYNNNSVQNT